MLTSPKTTQNPTHAVDAADTTVCTPDVCHFSVGLLVVQGYVYVDYRLAGCLSIGININTACTCTCVGISFWQQRPR